MATFARFSALFSAFLVLALTPGARTAHAQFGLPGGDAEPTGDDLVDFSVAVEHSPMNPEQGTMIALIWDVEDEWHVYWKNNGDTGAPLAWEFDLPEGVTAGEPRWPAPTRYVSGGFIVDFVLEGRVVVLVPLEISDEARAGMMSAGVGELAGRVRSEWLVCKEACLPGSGEAEVTIPFAATTPVERRPELFEEARRAQPVTREAVRRAAQGARDDGSRVVRDRFGRAVGPASRVGAYFRDGRLEIRAPGAASMEFFADPGRTEVRPADALNECAVEGDSMSVRFGGPVSGADLIGGVVRIDYGERGVVVLRLDVPGPASASAGEDPLG